MVIIVVVALVFTVVAGRLASGLGLNDGGERLLDFMLFALGIGVSLVVGAKQAKEARQVQIDAEARKSIRRAEAHFAALGSIVEATQRFGFEVETAEPERLSLLAKLRFEHIEDLMRQQVRTSDDALQDWRDLAPDAVDDEMSRLRERIRQRQQGDGQNVEAD